MVLLCRRHTHTHTHAYTHTHTPLNLLQLHALGGESTNHVGANASPAAQSITLGVHTLPSIASEMQKLQILKPTAVTVTAADLVRPGVTGAALLGHGSHASGAAASAGARVSHLAPIPCLGLLPPFPLFGNFFNRQRFSKSSLTNGYKF